MQVSGKYISLLLMIFLGVSIITGCQNMGAKVVKLDSLSQKNKLNINDTGIIELEENVTTGYTWHYKIKNENIIIYDSDSISTPKTDVPGAGSKHTWYFKAIKKGNTRLIFQYYRAWEKENIAETRIYNVEVK